MGIIKARKLGYDYFEYEEEGKNPEVVHAIEDIDLDSLSQCSVTMAAENQPWQSI